MEEGVHACTEVTVGPKAIIPVILMIAKRI